MSLLGIYVIIAYYKTASKNPDYTNKITNQKFDFSYIRKEISNLLSYQSDALHWNLSQLDMAGEVGQRAIEAYAHISEKLKVEIHSKSSAEKRIERILEGKKTFMVLSRDLAEKAQVRESVTVQPKEKLSGKKGVITIKNYLGGYYFFTCDEVKIHGRENSSNRRKTYKERKFSLLKRYKRWSFKNDIVDKLGRCENWGEKLPLYLY